MEASPKCDASMFRDAGDRCEFCARAVVHMCKRFVIFRFVSHKKVLDQFFQPQKVERMMVASRKAVSLLRRSERKFGCFDYLIVGGLMWPKDTCSFSGPSRISSVLGNRALKL